MVKRASAFAAPTARIRVQSAVRGAWGRAPLIQSEVASIFEDSHRGTLKIIRRRAGDGPRSLSEDRPSLARLTCDITKLGSRTLRDTAVTRGA